MKKEKAYKLLAIQNGISNRQAKEMIDRGLVYASGKKITVARGEMNVDVVFKVNEITKPKIIYEDKKILAINKPPFIYSEEISKEYNIDLLHRLDKETSGVLILCKDKEFRKLAVEEFRQRRVEKIYYALTQGKLVENIKIDSPILTINFKGKAVSKISKDGKEAITEVIPHMVIGNISLVEVRIKTGRTHQIRVHLQSTGYPVIGDEKYGGKPSKRVMLHAYKIKFLDYDLSAPFPKDFKDLGFLA